MNTEIKDIVKLEPKILKRTHSILDKAIGE